MEKFKDKKLCTFTFNLIFIFTFSFIFHFNFLLSPHFPLFTIQFSFHNQPEDCRQRTSITSSWSEDDQRLVPSGNWHPYRRPIVWASHAAANKQWAPGAIPAVDFLLQNNSCRRKKKTKQVLNFT